MQASSHNNELDAGPRSGGTDAERLCVATRTVKPIADMIRFVIGPQGVVPDLKRKLPGRGIWITGNRASIAEAVARQAFARGFKREVHVAADLAEQTEQLLVRAVLDALSIAGKSGLVPNGFGKVEAALARDNVVGLIHASDASSDGINKLKGALLQRPDADRIAMVREFTSAQLDLAMGRSNVVHAALLAGPGSDTFLARFQRLERFRTDKTGERGPGRAAN